MNIAISLWYILGFSVTSVFVNYVLRSKYMIHLSMTNVPHDIEWLSGSHANTTITIILIRIWNEINIYDNYGAKSNKLFITFHEKK